MLYQNQISEGGIIVYADIRLFSKDAVFKCLYWYGDKFHTTVTLQDDSFYRIAMIPISGLIKEEAELGLFLQKMERDLIDFSLRDIVTKETQNVRDLLVAKAFSNGEFDELPPGEISDPVGYDVNLQ